MTHLLSLSAAWDTVVTELARAPSTWDEPTTVTRLAQAIEHTTGGNGVVRVRLGQDVGARPGVLRVSAESEIAVATLRWVPPNVYRAHGYRLKFADDVRWLAGLVRRGEAHQALAAIVDLHGVIRPETAAALAAAFPSVLVRGYTFRFGAIVGGSRARAD